MKPLYLIIAILLSSLLTACGESEADRVHKKAVDTSDGQISLKLAHASESAGDFPSAERLYNEAYRKNGNTENLAEVVEFYKRHNGIKQAITLLDKAEKKEPDNVEILRLSANMYIDSGQVKKGIEVLDKALSINPEDGLLYNSKGVALDLLGEHKKARFQYGKALTIAPEYNGLVKTNLGMSYIMTGYYTKAINLLKHLADSSESTPRIRQNLSLAYGLKGDNENALKYAEKDLNTGEAKENFAFYQAMGKKGEKPPEKMDMIPAIP